VTKNFDSYNAGKIYGRFVRACTIADALFPQELAPYVKVAVDALEKYIGLWLERKNLDAYRIQYDTVWGGLTSKTLHPGNHYADYGLAFYNDHHFHWGFYSIHVPNLCCRC